MKLFVLAAAAASAAVLGLASASTPSVSGTGHEHGCIALEAQSASGTIRSVDLEGKSFVLGTEKGDVTLGVTQNTTFKLDGKESTMREALRTGAKAVVVHEGRIASSVDVQTKAQLERAAIETAEGSIRSVDPEGMGFVLTTAGGDVSLKVSAKTSFTLDGKESSMREAVKVGARARVAHEAGQATRVDVSTKQP